MAKVRSGPSPSSFPLRVCIYGLTTKQNKTPYHIGILYIEGGKVVRLTGNSLDPSAHDNLVAARAGAKGLVAHADEDDGEEAEEQPGGGVDVPFLEDDAEVGRVPGEEHLSKNKA